MSSRAWERFRIDEVGDGVVDLVIDRPDKLNAMDRLFFDELIDVMDHVTHEPSIRVVVLTGEGRAFSAGGDIATFPALTLDVDAARAHVRVVFDAFHAIERAGVPVIAAVNGIAHGGGLEILCAVDYTIAAEHATFGFRESAHGLVPGFGVVKGERKMGAAWTWRLVSTAEVIDVATAREIGVVQEVVAADALLDRAHELAAAAAANPASALRSAKHLLNRDTDAGLVAAVETTGLLFGTNETAELVERFLGRPRG